MGNILGRDPNQLDFKGIRTENFNSEIPYLNKLQNDSVRLANNLTKNLSDSNTINNREMYNAFNAQDSDNNFSDTSPLVDTSVNISATSALNSEITQLLGKIQKGGSLEQNNNEPVDFVSNDIIQQLLTETSKNHRGGSLDEMFINEDMIRHLMTETNEQSGGFFWNKKSTPKNETFINEETFKSLMENNNDPNGTSENNTEFNQYMNNAITELTSALEHNSQKGGDMMSSESEESSSSDSPTKPSTLAQSPVEEDIMKAVEEASGKSSDNMMSMGRNTYSSSSAHTNEIDSNNSNASSTVSANNDKYLSDSINTSDINMISVE
jgi:hypothetical protein